MSLVPAEEAQSVCAKFVAVSTLDELAVELDRVHRWLDAVVPPRFLDFSGYEQTLFKLTPDVTKLTGRVSALAQVGGLTTALTTALGSGCNTVVSKAAEIIAVMLHATQLMQPSSDHSISVLPPPLLADISLVRALVDVLTSTDTDSILPMVCKALIGVLHLSPKCYNAALLTHGIVEAVMARLHQCKSGKSNKSQLSRLLAAIISMSYNTRVPSKRSHSVLPPYSSADHFIPRMPMQESELNSAREFEAEFVSYASAIPLIAHHIDAIEHHFKECILTAGDGDSDEARTLIASGLVGLMGLVGNRVMVAMLDDTAVVARISHHLAQGVTEAIDVVKIIEKYGSMAAKNALRTAVTAKLDAKSFVSSIVEQLSTLSADEQNHTLVYHRLDLISQLYRYYPELRCSVQDSNLPGLLIKLLDDSKAELAVQMASIRTLVVVARSTLLPLPSDVLARAVAALVDVVRRFDHTELLRRAVEGLCEMKHTSAQLYRLCSQQPVHVILLERFDSFCGYTNDHETLEQTLVILSLLIDRDDIAAVTAVSHPDFISRLRALSGSVDEPSLAIKALSIWYKLLHKKIAVLSPEDKEAFVSNAIQLAPRVDVTVHEAGIAVEALYMVYDDLALNDRHRVVTLCRTLFQGDCHIALLCPVGILLDAVLHTLPVDDVERTAAFAHILSALDESASPLMNERAIAILNHESNELSFATPDILHALLTLVVSSRSVQSSDLLLCDVMCILIRYHQTAPQSTFILHSQLELDRMLFSVVLEDDKYSNWVRGTVLYGLISPLKSRFHYEPMMHIPNKSQFEHLLIELAGRLEELDPWYVDLVHGLAKNVIIGRVSDSTRLELRKVCLQMYKRFVGRINVSTLPAFLCAATVAVKCASNDIDDADEIMQILHTMADIVCDIAKHIDSHPSRLLLTKCLNIFTSMLRHLSPGVDVPRHEELVDAVLSIICNARITTEELVPVKGCLFMLMCGVPVTGFSKLVHRVQNELDKHLAGNNLDAINCVLFGLVSNQYGRPLRTHYWISNSSMYECVIKRLDSSIDDETFPRVIEQYSSIIQFNSTRLAQHGLINVLKRAVVHPNFSICRAAVEKLQFYYSVRHIRYNTYNHDVDILDTIVCALNVPEMLVCVKKCAARALEMISRRLTAPFQIEGPQIQARLIEMLPLLTKTVDELPSVHFAPSFVSIIGALISNIHPLQVESPHIDAAKLWLKRFINEQCFGVSMESTVPKASKSIHQNDHASQLCGFRILSEMRHAILPNPYTSPNNNVFSPALIQHLFTVASSDQYPSALRCLAISTVYRLIQRHGFRTPEQPIPPQQTNQYMAELGDIVKQLILLDTGNNNHNHNHNQNLVGGVESYQLILKAHSISVYILQDKINSSSLLVRRRRAEASSAASSTLVNSYCTFLSVSIQLLKRMPGNTVCFDMISNLLSQAKSVAVIADGLASAASAPITIPVTLRDVLYEAFVTSFEHFQYYKNNYSSDEIIRAFISLFVHSRFNDDFGGPPFMLDNINQDGELNEEEGDDNGELPPALQWQRRQLLFMRQIHSDFCIGFIRQHSDLICKMVRMNIEIECGYQSSLDDVVVRLAYATSSNEEFKELLLDTGIIRALFDGAKGCDSRAGGMIIQSICELMLNPQFMSFEDIWKEYVTEFTAILAKEFEETVKIYKEMVIKQLVRARLLRNNNNNNFTDMNLMYNMAPNGMIMGPPNAMFSPYMHLSFSSLLDALHPRRDRFGAWNGRPAAVVGDEARGRYHSLMKEVSKVDAAGNRRIQTALEECITYGPSNEGQQKQLQYVQNEYFGGCRSDMSLMDLVPVNPDDNPY
ncbi:hypothetical protein GQ42DRAFT_160006 [Ramicandelaber brevisporus]|nr:hypothetical protein GQ42DRAFT_160006 [Ramicandelaber brevisporus]